jgi:hypothetical protein
MRDRTAIRTNQQGLVSLVVTMIIMIVLSLIVVGFAQVARREQRIALDHQLSQQAEYAAESGINDAKRAVFDNANALAPNPYNRAGGSKDKKTCGPVAGTPLADNTLSDTVSYSCLLIDQSPPDLKYSNIQTDVSTVVPINAVDPATGNPVNINKIVLNWQVKDTTPAPVSHTYPKLPSAGGWGANQTGMLRTDVIAPGDLSQSALNDNLFTTFMYPSSGGSHQVTYAPTGSSPQAQGELSKADCSGGPWTGDPDLPDLNYQCRMDIDVSAVGSSSFFLRLRSIYNASQLDIAAIGTTGKVDLRGAQVEIDSTGKAQDVLKRVKVRAKDPDNSSGPIFTEYALDVAGGICKQIITSPVAGTTQDACNGVIGPPTSGPGGSPSPGGPGGPSGSDPNGDSLIASVCGPDGSACSNSSFTYGNPNDSRRWVITIINNSDNPDSVVAGCDWNFGDGTTLHNQYCHKGDRFPHQYTQSATCKKYRTTLVMHFNNGAPDKISPPKYYTVPDNNYLPDGSTEFNGPCPV